MLFLMDETVDVNAIFISDRGGNTLLSNVPNNFESANSIWIEPTAIREVSPTPGTSNDAIEVKGQDNIVTEPRRTINSPVYYIDNLVRSGSSRPHFEDSTQYSASAAASDANLLKNYQYDFPNSCILFTLLAMIGVTVFAVAFNLACPIFVLNRLDELVSEEVADVLKEQDLDTLNCAADWLPYRQNCYRKYRSKTARNYSRAVNFCDQLEATLAVPDSIADYSVMKALILSNEMLWLGINKSNGTWSSLSGKVGIL